jgi:RNA polymerase sigma-70 factor (ECF subfamily)
VSVSSAANETVEGSLLQSESALVARIRSGDIAAFEELYDEFAPGLLGFAFAQLRSRELAEELVQDLFLGLWTHRQKWVLTRALRSYLYGALRNRITSYRRTNAARHELRQSEGDSTSLLAWQTSSGATDDLVSETDLLHALDRAVEALPPRCRETFLLVRQQRLSYAEAASVLGVSVKAVEMNMLRAFQALRRHLADWYA